MDLSPDLATKNLDLGIFGDFWGDGADSAQKVDTLAGWRVSSTPGKRLAEVMTHPYINVLMNVYWNERKEQ